VRILLSSIAVVLASAEVAAALTYCAPGDEACRQAMAPPSTLHILMVIAGFFVFALGLRAVAWVAQWLKRR